MKKQIPYKSKRGGAKQGSGRKPLPSGEKSVQVPVYFKQKYIDLLGRDRIREIASIAIEKEYLKTVK